MEITPLNLTTLNCFCCNFLVVKHKCKLQLSDDIFLNICLCDICVKLEEAELRMKFMGKADAAKPCKFCDETSCKNAECEDDY